MVTVLLTGGIGSGKSTVRRILEGMGVPCYDADSAVKSFYAVPSEPTELPPTASGTGSGLVSGSASGVNPETGFEGNSGTDSGMASGTGFLLKHRGSRGAARPFLLPEIEEALGRSFRLPDGTFDSRALAGVIFSDVAKLKTVENIVFPALAADFETWRAACVSNRMLRRADCRERPGDSPDTPCGEVQAAFRNLPPFVVFESATALDKPEFPKVWDKCLLVDAPDELRIERVTARDRCTRADVLARLRLQPPFETGRGEVDATLLNDCPLEELRSRTVSALVRLFRRQ